MLVQRIHAFDSLLNVSHHLFFTLRLLRLFLSHIKSNTSVLYNTMSFVFSSVRLWSQSKHNAHTHPKIWQINERTIWKKKPTKKSLAQQEMNVFNGDEGIRAIFHIASRCRNIFIINTSWLIDDLNVQRTATEHF